MKTGIIFLENSIFEDKIQIDWLLENRYDNLTFKGKNNFIKQKPKLNTYWNQSLKRILLKYYEKS
jgi:hypothetical protein